MGLVVRMGQEGLVVRIGQEGLVVRMGQEGFVVRMGQEGFVVRIGQEGLAGRGTSRLSVVILTGCGQIVQKIPSGQTVTNSLNLQ